VYLYFKKIQVIEASISEKQSFQHEKIEKSPKTHTAVAVIRLCGPSIGHGTYGLVPA